MKRRVEYYFMALVLTVGLSGVFAFDSATSAVAADTARIRVAHLSPDSPNVDVYVDGKQALTSVPYGTISDYIALPTGSHNVKVFAAGADTNGKAAIDATQNLAANTDYTLAAVGLLANLKGTILTDDNSPPPTNSVKLRIFHAVPNAQNIDVAVKGGDVPVTNLAFGSATKYLQLPAATYNFEVRPTGTSTVALPINNLELKAGSTYTLVAGGLLNGTGSQVLKAVLQTDAIGVAAPGTGTASASPATTAPVTSPAATTVAATTSAPTTSVATTVAATTSTSSPATTTNAPTTNVATTTVATTTAPVSPVATTVAPTAAATTPVAATTGGTARVRIAHLSPDGPNVDVYADGNKVLSNVPYGTISDYLPLPAGAHEFKVFPAGAATSSSPAIDTKTNLTSGTDYTIGAAGQLANIKGITLTDDNTPPSSGKTRVRVVHASPDGPNVDVALKGGQVWVTNLPFGSASSYLEIPAGSYSFEVRGAGSTSVALPINNVDLKEGATYSLFAEGLVKGSGAQALKAGLQLDAGGSQAQGQGGGSAPGSLPASGLGYEAKLAQAGADTGLFSSPAILLGLIALLLVTGLGLSGLKLKSSRKAANK